MTQQPDLTALLTPEVAQKLIAGFLDRPGAAEAAQAAGVDLAGAKHEIASFLASTARRSRAAALFTEGLGLLREADAAEQRAKVSAAVDVANERAEQARALVGELEERTSAALADVRAAEDAFRTAEGHERALAEANRTAQRDGLTPAEQTELLVRVRAAGDVTARYRADLDGRRATLAEAESDLAAARQEFVQLDGIREQLEAAEAASDLRGDISFTTAAIALTPLKSLIGDAQTEAEYAVVEQLVSTLAREVGLDKRLRGEGRRELEDEISQMPVTFANGGGMLSVNGRR